MVMLGSIIHPVVVMPNDRSGDRMERSTLANHDAAGQIDARHSDLPASWLAFYMLVVSYR